MHNALAARDNAPLTHTQILRFWAPLAATWLMMASEGPILTSFIARMDDPIFNLAAYGAAHPLAMLIESPIIMMLSAAIALVQGKTSYLKVRNFSFALNIAVTALMLVVVIPPVFKIIAYDTLQLPTQVAEKMYIALWLLTPWPAAIGYRRFYQGVLISKGQTKKVALGTIARIFGMFASASLLQYLGFPGVVVGAGGLSAGVCMESLLTRFMAINAVRELLSRTEEHSENLNYSAIRQFYYPLALTSLIGMGVTPMLTFFIGKSVLPIQSLAIFPIVDSFVFLFRSFGFAYQEVGIALLGEKHKHYREIAKFGQYIALATTATLAAVAFTPLADIVLKSMYGLQGTLAEFAIAPIKILFVLPALSVMYTVQRAVVINAKKNTIITASTIVEVVSVVVAMIIFAWIFHLPGAIAAAIAMVLCRIISNTYLSFHYVRILRDSGKIISFSTFFG